MMKISEVKIDRDTNEIVLRISDYTGYDYFHLLELRSCMNICIIECHTADQLRELGYREGIDGFYPPEGEE